MLGLLTFHSEKRSDLQNETPTREKINEAATQSSSSTCSSRRLASGSHCCWETNSRRLPCVNSWRRNTFCVSCVNHTCNPKAERPSFVDYQHVINYYIPAFHRIYNALKMLVILQFYIISRKLLLHD